MVFDVWRIRFVAIASILLIVAFGLFFTKRSAPLILPLSFLSFTNAAGEASALLQCEMPHSAWFFNLQSWSYEDLKMRVKLQNGSFSTNALMLKATDINAFPSGSNMTVQIRVSLPTNASAFAVSYSTEVEEGLSIGSLELFSPRVKRFSYRSKYIPVSNEMSNAVRSSSEP